MDLRLGSVDSAERLLTEVPESNYQSTPNYQPEQNYQTDLSTVPVGSLGLAELYLIRYGRRVQRCQESRFDLPLPPGIS